MSKKSGKISMEDVMQLANSEAGRQLISMLKAQNPTVMEKAAGEAAAGHYQEAAKTLSGTLDAPQISALLEKLRGSSHG